MVKLSRKQIVVLVLIFGSVGSCILAANYFWMQRFRMSGDGVSYVEVGEWILGYHREGPLSSVWSPLYGVFLAGFLRLFDVTGPEQVLFLQLANFFIYAAALASFMWMIWLAVHDLDRHSSLSSSAVIAFITGSLIIFNYCAISLIGAVTSPDMLLLAITCLVAVFVLKLEGSFRSWHAFVLGVVLGMGYLAKSIFFPVSLLFIVVMAIYSFRGALYALVGFSIVSLPFVALLSLSTGRITIGDSARMVYALANRVPARYWMGGPNGTPIHPPRILHTDPDVFEFGGPPFTQFSFPPHYNPAYWQEGLLWTFDLGTRLRAMRYHADALRKAVVNKWSILAVLLSATAWFFTRRKSAHAPHKSRGYINALIVSGLGAIAAYVFIGVEPRYLGPFIAVLVPAVWLSARPERSWVVTLFGILSLPLILPTVSQVGLSSSTDDVVLAETLIETGIQPGSRVAAIGGNSSVAVWARLSGLRISAHVPNARQFWSSPEEIQQNIFDRLRLEGIVAMVAVDEFETLDSSWRRVPGSGERAIRVFDPTEGR